MHMNAYDMSFLFDVISLQRECASKKWGFVKNYRWVADYLKEQDIEAASIPNASEIRAKSFARLCNKNQQKLLNGPETTVGIY